MAGAQQTGLRKRTPPFPTKQMTILGEFCKFWGGDCFEAFANEKPALCRICEPIAFMSIFPYVYFMIKDFGVTKHEAEIAVYAGMVTSAFAFAEFSSGVVWGRLSDRIGRKPVLITGLAGTALSMLIFGFAPNLPVALLARALGGLLNGYVDVPGSCTDAVR
jgi:MFS family permease